MTIWVKGDGSGIDLAFRAWFTKLGINAFIREEDWIAGYKAIIKAFKDYYLSRGKTKTYEQLKKMVSNHGSKYRELTVLEKSNSTRSLGDANLHEKRHQKM